jgi:hypothetical protein
VGSGRAARRLDPFDQRRRVHPRDLDVRRLARPDAYQPGHRAHLRLQDAQALGTLGMSVPRVVRDHTRVRHACRAFRHRPCP